MQNRCGALIVHGLTATPATMAPTIEAMAEAGYTVLAPLLPGHGTTEHDLEQTIWQDWAAAVQAAYDDLATRCDSIYYIGLSLGALLGLHLAASVRPEPVEGQSGGSIVRQAHDSPRTVAPKLRALALMATPLHLSPFVRRIVPMVRYSPIRWLYTASPKDWKTSVADPEGLKAYQESSYARIPTKSVYQVYDLEGVVAAELGRIRVPTFVIHSRQDEVAPPSNVTVLQLHLNSPLPKIMWLEKSYHVITLDYERDEVNQAILRFCERNSK